MKKQIALLDFDGTLTTRDTLLEFIKFSKGPVKCYAGFLLNSPWLVAYKLKLVSNQRAKEAVLRFFFRGMRVTDFDAQCRHFAEEVIPGLTRPKGLEEIRKLQEAGFEVVIVSASPANWIQPWAGRIGAGLIATRLELGNGNGDTSEAGGWLTGKISGKNCYGVEKVGRIREQYRLEEYDDIYAYGDSKGDLPMLALGNRSFFKPFR